MGKRTDSRLFGEAHTHLLRQCLQVFLAAKRQALFARKAQGRVAKAGARDELQALRFLHAAMRFVGLPYGLGLSPHRDEVLAVKGLLREWGDLTELLDSRHQMLVTRKQIGIVQHLNKLTQPVFDIRFIQLAPPFD